MTSYFLNIILALPAIIVAVTFHEMAHGLAAEAMGDKTAESMGRLSLNPLAHVSWLGLLSMIFFRFGWAKPVPVNPNNFRNRRQGIIVTSLAGCLMNLFLGFIAVLVLDLLPASFKSNYYLYIIFYDMIVYNIMFGLFNLIPIPPLDGSQILAEFLPYRARVSYERFSRYGMWVLFILVWTGVISMILTPAINGVYTFYQFILSPIVSLFH